MKVKIEDSWSAVLSEEFEKLYFKSLTDFVRSEYQSKTIYPEGKNIFNAFNHCPLDRKSTRLNSSHVKISYAVFCLKKKKITYKMKLSHLWCTFTRRIQRCSNNEIETDRRTICFIISRECKKMMV